MYFRCLCLVVASFVGSISVNAQSYHFAFKNGDLLFQDLDCGGLCDAIEKVTSSVNGRHFSHIGLVFVTGDSTMVIEAIGKDVHLTPLVSFLGRQKDTAGQPKVVVGRVLPRFARLVPSAVAFAKKQLGKPYDAAFRYANGKYYCSELIYDAFKKANAGRPFFPLMPMTFKDPETGATFPAWTDYYKELGEKIPEGKPGCNPGGISASDKIAIVAAFY